MKRNLLAALGIAGIALAAACGGGGHSTPATPSLVSSGSGGVASGKVVLTIPNATGMSEARKALFVSSGANSAAIALNGGAPTIFDVSSGSSNCVTTTVRTCSLPITSGGGTLTVTVTLYATTNGTGTPLGSATSAPMTVTPPTTFNVMVDINPAVTTALTPVATFANGLPTIAYKTSETGSFALTFKDPSGTVIPSTNSSTFLTPVTLTASDPHVTFSGTINNASQTAQIVYDGSASVAATVTVTAKAGTTTIGTFTMKTAGFLAEFATPTTGSQPSGIAAGADGMIWFLESFTSKVARVNFPAPYTGTPTIAEFPLPTPSVMPFAIAAGPSPDTHMWISDASNFSIAYVDTAVPSPAPLETNAPGTNWKGVTSLGGFVWYLNGTSNNMYQVDPGTHSFTGMISPLGTNCNPNIVAPGPDSMLWVTCNAENEIYRVDPANLGSPASIPITPTGVVGIAAGPDSAMWFCDSTNGNIGRVSIPGLVVTEYPVPSGAGAGPANIVQGADGAMWFTETVANKIGRIDVNTKAMVEFPVTGAASPAFITSGPDGWLWFTETGTNSIGRMQTP